MKGISIRTALFAAALVALASVPAKANTITPSFNLAAWAPGTSVTYDAAVSSGELHSGDGFTIFDIGGYTGVIAIPANWTFGAFLTGSPYSSPLLPLTTPDDPTLVNVTFRYTGPTIQVLAATAFFGFVVGTNSFLLIEDDWRSRDHLIGSPAVVGDGAQGPATGATILVPLGPAGPGQVPDGGSTAALLGSVLVAFGMLRRRFS